jgi:hypothetical protein
MTRKAVEKPSSYEQIFDGHWFKYEGPFDLACCSCGHTHEIDVRLKDGVLQMRLTNRARSTAMLRRHHGITLKVKTP